MACGPSHLELSKSYMDMASKLFTFTYMVYVSVCTAYLQVIYMCTQLYTVIHHENYPYVQDVHVYHMIEWVQNCEREKELPGCAFSLTL